MCVCARARACARVCMLTVGDGGELWWYMQIFFVIPILQRCN